MARFFLEPESWGEDAELIGDEAVHCSRVLRSKVGDPIEVFDGAGRWAEAEILSVSRNRIGISLGEHLHAPKPEVHIVLAQAVLKGKAMDWLIPKAVELGVSSIQPLWTKHCVVRSADEKADKWRRSVLEACKQCGQRYLPEVMEPVSLEDFLNSPMADLRIVAALAEPRRQLRELVEPRPRPQSASFVVGPEGDFSATELESLIEAGFQPASLGPRVLRSETAAVFGLAALGYAFA